MAASDLCSLILDTFPHNVKALFRRAVAYMKLNRFLEAKTDLVEALVVEPRNKDVKRELDVVKGYLLIKENGKRVLEVITEDSVEGDNKKHVHVSDTEVDIQDSESVIMEVTEDHSDVSIKDNASLNMEMAHANSEKNDHIPHKSIHEFSKKGGGNSRLRICGQAYQKLLQGNKVNYYHKRDLSFITIRIINIEATKEGEITREHGKMKKRSRRSEKRKLTKMTGKEDTSTSSDIINEIHGTSLRASSFCAKSSSSSSICDNFSPPDIQILQRNSMAVAPSSLVNDTATPSTRPQTTYDSNDHPTFLFSCKPKKCEISPSSKLLRAPITGTLCRYPSIRRASHKKRFLTPRITAKGMSLQDTIYLLSLQVDPSPVNFYVLEA